MKLHCFTPRQLVPCLGIWLLCVSALRQAQGATSDDFDLLLGGDLSGADDVVEGGNQDAVNRADEVGEVEEDVENALKALNQVETENSSEAGEEDNVVNFAVAPSSGPYHVVLASMDALKENGVHVIGESGEIAPHLFPNLVASPNLSQLLGNRTLKQLDQQLRQKGFTPRGRKEIALVRYNGVDIPVADGRCQSGGVYLFVKLAVTSGHLDSNQDVSLYHFEALESPRGFSRGMYFSVPAEAVVVHGGRGVDQNDVVLLACIHRGDHPVIFPEVVNSPEEVPVFSPEPFEKEVEILQAEALPGSQAEKAGVLRTRLVYTTEGTPTSQPFTFLGTFPEPGVHQNAFVLGSLKKDSRCKLRREKRSGPVSLSCSAWKAVEQELEKIARLSSAGSSVRKSRAITAGVLSLLAALSAAAVLLGFQHEPQYRHLNMHLKGYKVDYSLHLRQKGKVENTVGFTLADSIDPRNLGYAFRRLTEPRDRAVAASVLLRGGGVYGAVAAAVAGILGGAGFLGEKIVRSAKKFTQLAKLKRQTRDALMSQTAEDSAGDKSEDRVLLYIVTP